MTDPAPPPVLRFDHYDWRGGRESMLRLGPDTGPVMVVALPLLEEANRTRTFVVTLLRALARRGIGSVLPDMPGQGESVAAIGDQTLLYLAEAHEAVSEKLWAEGRPTVALGIRSGALLDYCALHSGRWHLAPTTGAAMLRDLHRIWLAAESRPNPGLDAMMFGDTDPQIAGTTLTAHFLSSLTVAEPFDQPGTPRRIVRLDSDPADADRKVTGVPLWRRSEPGNDAALADLLADDIATWLPTCAS